MIDYSQDVLRTQSQVVHRPTIVHKPWMKNWECEDVAQLPQSPWEVKDASRAQNTSASRDLPSIREIENVSDVAVLGNISFPISELILPDGVRALFSHSIKMVLRIRKGEEQQNFNEFYQTLNVIEYIGCCGQLDSSTFRLFLDSLKRLVEKVHSFTKDRQSRAFLRNIPSHVPLLVWKTAVSILSFAETHLTPQENDENRPFCEQFLSDLFIVMVVGLVQIHKHQKTAVPCKCVEDALVGLFRDQFDKFWQVFLKIFKQSVGSNDSIKTEVLNVDLASPLSMTFLPFYLGCLKHFMSVGAIGSKGDISDRFIPLLFTLVDQKALDLIETCRLLSDFLIEFKPSELGCSAATKRIVNAIKCYVESNHILSLDCLLDNRSDWASAVKDLLTVESSTTDPAFYMFKLLAALFSNETLWNGCRSVIFNNSGKVKVGMSGKPDTCGGVTTLLLTVIAHVADVSEAKKISENFGEWMIEGFDRGNKSVQQCLINAAQTLDIICGHRNIPNQSNSNLTKMLVLIKLPDCGTLFLNSLSAMSGSLGSINLDRSGKLSDEDFLVFLRYLWENERDTEIFGEVTYNRAMKLIYAGKDCDQVVCFVVNQICLGLQRGTHCATFRFKTFMERMKTNEKENTHLPSANSLLHFGNTMLARFNSGKSQLNLDDFVPLWIFALCAFSNSDELRTKQLTSNISKGVSNVFQQVCPGYDITFSMTEKCEIYLIRVFEALAYIHTIRADWALKRVELWIPPWLSFQLQALLKGDSVDVRDRTIRVCVSIYHNLSIPLRSIAFTPNNVSRNRNSFVLLLSGGLLDKKVVNSPEMKKSAPQLLLSLARCNLCVYVRPRIKELRLLLSREQVEQCVIQLREYGDLSKLLEDKDLKPLFDGI